MSGLDVRALAAYQPASPQVGTDTTVAATATVLEVDAAAGFVRVSRQGSSGAWVRAVAGRYVPDGECQVLLDPWRGARAALVVGPVDVRPPVVVATLVGAPDEVAHRATVTWEALTWVVPFVPAVYTTGAPVWVTLDDWGRPVRVDGPSDDPAPAPTPAPVAPGGSV